MNKLFLAAGILGVGSLGIGALGAGAIGLASGGYLAYRQAFYAKGSKQNIKGYFENNVSFKNAKDGLEKLIAEANACPFEGIYIKSFDNLTLYAKYYHIKDGAPLQILIHGYKGNAVRDMCGAHKLARELGHNILLIDQRGCGKSDGKTITFGVLERQDILSWIRYSTVRFNGAPIFLCGVSMGGAVALMTTDMALPKNVMGAIADCPYSSPADIVKKVCTDRGIPKQVFPFASLGGRLYGRFDIKSQSPVKSVQYSKIPILIMHGELDSFVPYKMAQEIYNSAKCEKYIHLFEGADHCASYMSNPEKYKEIVSEFTEKCLNNRHVVDKNTKEI